MYVMTSTNESQGISHERAGVTFYKHILRVKNPQNEPYPIVRLIGHRGSASKAVQSIAKTVSDLKCFFLSHSDVFIVTGEHVVLSVDYCVRNKIKKPEQNLSSKVHTSTNNSTLCNGDRMNSCLKPELNISKHIENSESNVKINIIKAVGFFLSKLFEKSGFAPCSYSRLIGYRTIASAEIQNIVKNPKQLKMLLNNFPKLFRITKEVVAILPSVFLEISMLMFCLVKCIEENMNYEVSFDKLLQSRNEAPSDVQELINNASELKDSLSKYKNIFEIKGSSIILDSEFITKLKEKSNNLESFIIFSVCNEVVSIKLQNTNVKSMQAVPSVDNGRRMNSVHSSKYSTSFIPLQPDSAGEGNFVNPSPAVQFFMEKLWQFGLCRVLAINDLFKCKSEASKEIQAACGNNIQEFKAFLCQHPQSFIVTHENVLARRNVPRKKWCPALRGVEEPTCSIVLNFFKTYTLNGKPEHIGKLYSTIGKCFIKNDGELLFKTSKDLHTFLDMFPQYFYIFDDHVVNILYHDIDSVKQLSGKHNSKVKSKIPPKNTNKDLNCDMDETIDWKKDVLNKTTYIDSLESCQNIIDRILEEENVIALDCEGYNLGVGGHLSLIQIAKEDGQVYVFDVYKEPELIISGNLKNILESDNIVKVIHDCRNDSANLYCQCNVTLKKVFDTRIAHSVISNPNKVKDFPSIGFNKLCEIYGAPINPQKDELKDVYKTNPAFWLTRPLDRDMLAYAALDVACLVPHVYNAMQTKLEDREKEMVFQLSEKYSKSRFNITQAKE